MDKLILSNVVLFRYYGSGDDKLVKMYIFTENLREYVIV